MPNVYKYFFQCTNDLHNEIIDLQDFILPAATALWNFRKTINHEFSEDLLVTPDYLANKYNTAPLTRGSTNLIIPFRETSWENQREKLAEISLVNIIALYEIWCENICSLFQKPDMAIKLQFPSPASESNGVKFAIKDLQSGGSSIIDSHVKPSLQQSKKYSLSTINNLLICFRYFKELRNCLMHRGRTCDGKLWGAQSAFVPVANQNLLGMDFVPEYFPAQQGNSVRLSFHGILGFTDVILRIATTIDAELSASPEGEINLLNRMRERTTMPTKLQKLPNLFVTLGWNNIDFKEDFVQFLKNNGVLPT